MPITVDKQQPPPPKKSGPPIGLVIIVGFALFRIFGSQISSVLRNGNLAVPTLSGNTLFLIVGGIVALVVALSIILRVSSSRTRGDSSLPTTIGPAYRPTSNEGARRTPGSPGNIPSLTLPMQRTGGMPQPQSYIPSAPRYERALNGKALLAGLVAGGFILGGLFLLFSLGLI